MLPRRSRDHKLNNVEFSLVDTREGDHMEITSVVEGLAICELKFLYFFVKQLVPDRVTKVPFSLFSPFNILIVLHSMRIMYSATMVN